MRLTTPAHNERGPRYMEKALAAMHQAGHDRRAIRFEYGGLDETVGLFVRCQDDQEPLVAGPLVANYPNCSLSPAEEETIASNDSEWSIELTLVPELFPILRHAQFEDALNRNFADPINGILRAIKPNERLRARIEISVTPSSHRRSHVARKTVERLDRQFFRTHHQLARFYARTITRPWLWAPGWILGLIAGRSEHTSHSPLDSTGSRLHDREDDLQAAADKLGGHLFEARIRLTVRGPADFAADARVQLRNMAGAFGAFTRSRLATFRASAVRRGNSRKRICRGFLLSHEELATLWHPPTSTVAAEKMPTSEFTELEAPTSIPHGTESGAVILGRVRFRNDDRAVGINLDDRRRHVYIVGRTGVGKTTLLLNQIHSDLSHGHGLTVIDPHGDLAETVLSLIPSERTNDVIYLDAADSAFAVAFNPLACADDSRLDQVTSGVVSALKRIYDSWGPRLENTLRNAVFATVELGGTLQSLLQLLTDDAHRECVVAQIRDDVVRAFWQHEFASWTRAYRTEAVAAVTNKLQPFLTSRSIRGIVSQASQRSLDLRQVMDNGSILIANLSKGRIGEDNAMLLGAFLVAAIQQAALTRAEVPEQERRDHFLIIDEFQNFISTSFESILSEARKYRLNLTVAHQYMSQLDEPTRAAIAGNIGTIISFAVGSDDAEWLATAMAKHAGQLLSQDLTNLPKHTAYVRLLHDGMPTPPFSINTIPPPKSDSRRADIVRRTSQRRYGRTG